MVPPTFILKFLLPGLCVGCLVVSRISAQDNGVVSEIPEPAATMEAPEAAVEAPTSVLDEKVIPEPFGEGRYQTTWNSNPFLRKTVVVAGPRVDWSQDWALAGMYKSTTGKIIISMQNKQTSEFKRVASDDGADSEFRLVKANFNRNRLEASAEIAKGSETATLKYDDNLTSKPVTINNTLRPAGTGQPGAPGTNPNIRQPGQPPGQPVNVTQPGMARPGQQLPNNAPGVNPNGIQPGPAAGAPTPPTISRRRQLIPAPVVPPPAQQ